MTGSKTQRIVGWVLTALLGLFLIVGSAVGKFIEWEGKAEMFAKFGITTELVFKIGVLEVIITVLFLIPRTAFLGAILLTGYLGGAMFVHIRVGDPFVMPLVMGVVIWVALALRRPEIWRLAFASQQQLVYESGY
jgi:hypothetical protein